MLANLPSKISSFAVVVTKVNCLDLKPSILSNIIVTCEKFLCSTCKMDFNSLINAKLNFIEHSVKSLIYLLKFQISYSLITEYCGLMFGLFVCL